MRTKDFNVLLNKASTDSTAFGKLYVFLLPKLVWYVQSRFGDNIDPYDVSHDFFDMLLQGRFNEVSVQYPLAWAYRICFNTALREVKKQQRQGELCSSCEPVYAPDQALCVAVNSALVTLKEPDKTIVRLKGMYGVKFDEIAEITELNISTVKTTYYRALKQLKKILE